MRLLIALSTAFLIGIPTLAVAFDCHGVTPLPDDVRTVPPAADVGETIAKFAGAWTGAWRDARDVEARCPGFRFSRPT